MKIEYPFVYALVPRDNPMVALPIPTRMSYEPEDPWAITIAFDVPQPNGGTVETVWTFARELLIDAFSGPAGLGDIKIWIEDGEQFHIQLTSNEGQAHVWTDVDSVRAFLNHTTQIVPRGEESSKVNLDKELRELME